MGMQEPPATVTGAERLRRPKLHARNRSKLVEVTKPAIPRLSQTITAQPLHSASIAERAVANTRSTSTSFSSGCEEALST